MLKFWEILRILNANFFFVKSLRWKSSPQKSTLQKEKTSKFEKWHPQIPQILSGCSAPTVLVKWKQELKWSIDGSALWLLSGTNSCSLLEWSTFTLDLTRKIGHWFWPMLQHLESMDLPTDTPVLIAITNFNKLSWNYYLMCWPLVTIKSLVNTYLGIWRRGSEGARVYFEKICSHHVQIRSGGPDYNRKLSSIKAKWLYASIRKITAQWSN